MAVLWRTQLHHDNYPNIFLKILNHWVEVIEKRGIKNSALGAVYNIAGIRTRFWTNLHAFVAVCGASPGHVVQWRQWHCQLCWVCHRRPNSRRSFNRNKAKKFRPKTTRPSRNWTVKLNTYHPEGRETLRSALGNGYVWFHSSLRSDELKRTLYPRAVSQCFAPFRMICN